MSAAALSMFSMVRRSPRRWRAFPPTAMTMRSLSVEVAEYCLRVAAAAAAAALRSEWRLVAIMMMRWWLLLGKEDDLLKMR